jgi:hypothetical protein
VGTLEGLKFCTLNGLNELTPMPFPVKTGRLLPYEIFYYVVGFCETGFFDVNPIPLLT